MSLVAVRMPALQCKGGERRIRTDIIRLRKGKGEKEQEMVLSTLCPLWSSVHVCVCDLAPSWLGLSTDVSRTWHKGQIHSYASVYIQCLLCT